MGLLYHVWFSTKGRKIVFEDEIGVAMKEMLMAIAHNKGIRLIELELVADQHLLVEVAKRQNLASVMHQLKGASARFVFLEYPDLKIDMEGESFLQKGYGKRWVPRDQIDVVRRYIRTQRDRPYRRAS